MNPQQPLALLPFEKLIKPAQVQNLACLTPEQKVTYLEGITGLWKKVHDNPDGHPDRVQAHKKLTEVSNRLRGMMQKWKMDNGGIPQQNGARPTGQVQQQPVQQPMANIEESQAAAQRPQDQFSESVKTQVRNLTLALPSNLWNLPREEKQVWVQNEKRTYAMYAQKFETSSQKMAEFKAAVSNRQQQGRSFTPEEKQSLNVRLHTFQQPINEAREWLVNFKRQQEQYREQQMAAQQAAARAGNPIDQNQPIPPQIPAEQSNMPNNLADDPQNQPTKSERPDLTQQRPPSQPVTSQPNVPAAMSMPPTTGPQTTSGGQNPQAPNASQFPASQSGGSNPQAPGNHPHPLSHKAAVAQAQRSYSQTSVNQATPQSSTHAHPNLNPRDQQQNNSRWQPGKPINVTPLAPVAMGPARPTLSGGPSTGAPGPMGQPGVTKFPGYVLEGEGERVLSKKKLEELVRQVTGGGEAEGKEALDPDVEEILLELADEFVDNVIIAACRLAKLRQSATLDIRDLQIILERNYNIRVPGYASDELRTVKKIQPTQAWTQKMNAVQAAKVTGGKGDV